MSTAGEPDAEPDAELYCETADCPMQGVPISNPFGYVGIQCGTCAEPLHEPEPEDAEQ